MNGYVEAGYIVAIGTLGTYAVSVLRREGAARRRAVPTSSPPTSPTDALLSASDPVATFGYPDDERDGEAR